MKQLNVYAAGGTGVNIVSHFAEHSDKEAIGFASIKPYFIDTSKSNLKGFVRPEQFYFIESDGEKEGAGKKRDSRYHDITDNINKVLHEFKPTEFNLVVHSAAGGSGSVIGPVLVSQLLSRDVPTIALVVGNTSSLIETQNTLKTLQSYESISRTRSKPVIVAYLENNEQQSRTQVDEIVKTLVVSLASLLSGQNLELDDSDLVNWLNYHHVTSYEPHLSALHLFVEQVELGKEENLLSLATLAPQGASTESEVPVEYQAVGYLDKEVEANFESGLPLHFGIVSGYFQPVINKLANKVAEFEAVRKAAVHRPIEVSSDALDDGLIL